MVRWRRLAVTVGVALVAVVANAHGLVPPLRHVATARDAAALLRDRLAGDYALGPGSIAASERTSADLRPLIRDRIDRRLLDGALAVRGTDYRFTPADGARRHAGLVVVRYAGAAVAAARARPLLGDRQFFGGTEILTPMVVAVRGDAVVVFFTESGGDARLRAALVGAAARFRGG